MAITLCVHPGQASKSPCQAIVSFTPSPAVGRTGQQAVPERLQLGPARQSPDQYFICWFLPAGTAAPSQEARSRGADPFPPPQSLATVPLFNPQAPGAGPSTLPPPASVPSLSEIEALATQLAAPRSSAPAPRSQLPLLLSSALPPIPARVVEKIRTGAFVEMRELLPDNVSLLQRLQETSLPGHPPPATPSRLRDIRDPLSWAACFMAFVAAKVESPETRELMAYKKIIISLVQRHSGLGWTTYDTLFRQQVAAGAEAAWSQLNPSLMAATVLGATGEQSPRPCSHCRASDHKSQECALAPLDPNQAPLAARSSARFRPYRQPEEVCRRFNRGTCMASPCKFDHVCSSCQKPGHGSHECRRASSRPTGSEPNPPPAKSSAH